MPVRVDKGVVEQPDGEVRPIIVKVINTFKHDSRAFIEQRLIDNLVGLCRASGTEFQAYIHVDLIDKFVDWLNENNLEMAERSHDMSWEAIALNDDNRLDFNESDDLFPLFIGRTKIGYARGSEGQTHYGNILNKVFTPRLLKAWKI